MLTKQKKKIHSGMELKWELCLGTVLQYIRQAFSQYLENFKLFLKNRTFNEETMFILCTE